MAVGFDASSESHTGTTGSTSEASFNWTHTPSGSPSGVLVFTFVNANADDATAVSYGSSSLTAVSGGRAVDTAGEPRECKAWFLGSSVPTGAQTVTITRNNNANVMYAVAITVTAGAGKDTAVHTAGIVLREGDLAMDNRSPDDGTPGTNSMRFAGGNSAVNTYSTTLPSSIGNGIVYVNTNFSTALQHIDFGNNIIGVVRETTAGQGARQVGWTVIDTDDTAAVYLAVKEIDAAPSTTIKDLLGIGIIPFKR
jgi:hypothetical protein